MWQRMENTINRETTQEIERKREFHGVIGKIRKLPKPNEAGPSTSNTKQTQPEEESFEMETLGFIMETQLKQAVSKTIYPTKQNTPNN